MAGCCVTRWSRIETTRALSSCEAELYSMGRAAVEVLGVHAFLVEQGFAKEPPVVYGDSSSALQLANRTAAGRLNHVEVGLLAIQSWVAAGRLRLMTSAKCGERGRRADEARLQRYLGEAMCTSESESNSLSLSSSGMRDMQLSRCASLEVACH